MNQSNDCVLEPPPVQPKTPTVDWLFVNGPAEGMVEAWPVRHKWIEKVAPHSSLQRSFLYIGQTHVCDGRTYRIGVWDTSGLPMFRPELRADAIDAMIRQKQPRPLF